MTITNTSQPMLKPLENQEVAARLEQVAEMLEAQNANPFRVQAYRNAAELLRNLERPAHEILTTEGVEGLQRLPGIGQSLANSIEQLVYTGKIPLLERLHGETRPTRVLATVPGIGPKLAERIHDQLDIESLGELLTAAYDGRLSHVPGFGNRRIRAIQELLVGRLRRPRTQARVQPRQPENQPPVADLLDVDREYRAKARGKQLPHIAPRRFNPTQEAWLPVLHTERNGTQYSALYSNTARAHELEMTHDWVVIYRDDQNGDGQWTVVTSQYGPLHGKRIVRGREKECEVYYRQPVPA
ncbi:MAG: helix-hairpin-helix domain-containing protein [Caldilineaceae bacterium]